MVRAHFPLTPLPVALTVIIALAVCLPGGISAQSQTAADDDSVKLLRDGASFHRVVLGAKASPSEKTAADELVSHFRSCTGVELPIVRMKPGEDIPGGDRPMIVVGRGPVARRLGVAPTDEQLGEQGCLVRTVGPHIVIAGTAGAGTLQGVRWCLERQLGVRWYAPGVTKTPKHTDITVAKTDLMVQPSFLWRQTSYAWPGADAAFRSRRGMNRGKGTAEHPQGIHYYFDGTCHSYFRFISPGEFFETHPEYFSEINGSRVKEETQLCLTNPQVLEIVTERMLQRMKNDPDCRQHNFSQMDWYNYCECSRCRAMNEKYQTTGGTQYWFVNELARRTSKLYPQKQIGTLAYTYTEKPPVGLEMHPNVAVWLCHMFPSCDSHPIATCSLNDDYRQRAVAWSKICQHLCAWHYIVDFAHYYNPFPNFRAMDSDFKFYHRLGFEGIFAQAMGAGGGGGEFSLLRGYLSSELLKDPSQQAEQLIQDFLEGYYGSAAGPIGEYITMLHDKVQEENIHMHLYTNPAQGYLTDEVLARADALFDRAEAAVEDDAELLERVRVARMPIQYARAFPRNGYEITDGRLVCRPPVSTMAENQEFIARMKRHGFRSVRERGGSPTQHMMIATAASMPMPLVTLKNEHTQVDVAPFLGGRALRIIDRKTGRCATAHNTTKNIFFPFCGGEDSRVGGESTFDRSGLMTPAEVVKASGTSVTLKSAVGWGLEIHRTISLLEDRPGVTIRMEVHNPNDKPQQVQMRSHLSLDLGDVQKVRVDFTSLSGKKVNVDMGDVIAGYREGLRYYKTDCPAGSWTFKGPVDEAKPGGLRVIQRFDNRMVDFTRLCAYPADLDELEVELWAKKRTVPSGGSASFEHEIELRAE